MKGLKGVGVLIVAGFGPIDRDIAKSRHLYADVLGIAFKQEADGYLHTEALSGAKSFALWPLSQAALSCFGKDSWPASIPAPQAWVEFDVENVEVATTELEAKGYKMLVRNKKEPWGQVVSRFISPEGVLVGVTFTPSMRDGKKSSYVAGRALHSHSGHAPLLKRRAFSRRSAPEDFARTG